MSVDMNTKIFVENLCSWGIGFRRINTNGDVSIPAHAKVTLTADEIQSQCYANNKLFVGIDGNGSHANLFINNKDLRIELGFESEDSKDTQFIINEEKVKELFNAKTLKQFKNQVEKDIITDAEKALVVDLIGKLKLNDYDKIKFIEDYTQLKVNV